jgi:hypothetical protein
MSNFRMLLEFLGIMFISYLVINFIIFIIGDYNSYRECLRNYYNIYLLFLVYWWIPVFRMVDIEKKEMQ